MVLKRFFTGKIIGVPIGSWNLFCAVMRSTFRRLFSIVKLSGIGCYGRNCRIGLGVVINFPSKINLSDGVWIADSCIISSEFPDGQLEIGSDSHIDRLCRVDFSGGVTIGKNCTFSEGVVIESHDHGYSPSSVPRKCPLQIGDGVWLGMRCMILPQVTRIGHNAIIGAGAVVTHNVPDNTVVAGNPAKTIKYLA